MPIGPAESFPRAITDRYEIERLLGRGGMSTVFLARDRKHDRRVALKVLDADVAQTVGAQRFLREIHIVANLTHPHILPLHDSGEADGVLYYVMPFVSGETLRARLGRGPVEPTEALRIACEVCSALDYAHRQNVLHRDVKPENILSVDGHAVLADFGIARAGGEASASRVTATGIVVGTPAYMSPEQLSGDPSVDARSDIYSLGCVLYEMLTGSPPFQGATLHALMASRLTGPPPAVRAVRPEVTVEVENVLLRAMALDREDRFPSALAFRDAMGSCASSDTASRAATAKRSRTRHARSRPLLAAALVVTLGIAAWALRRPIAASFDRRAATVTTLAVLPFEHAAADADNTFLADGLAGAVIADLVRVPGLRVISRMSVMRYASDMDESPPASARMGEAMSGAGAGMQGMPTGPGMAPMAAKSPPQIARELGADVLLRGRLSRQGDSIRLSASLVRPATNSRIWEGTYVRPRHALLELQRDLRDAIVASLEHDGGTSRGAQNGVQLAGDVRSTVARYAPEAHEAYLKGAYYMAHWKLSQAVGQFERAVEIDARHAPAHAALARAYYFLAFFGDIPPSVALAAMRRSANAALAQDSLLADAHAQLALVKMLQDWDWDGADVEFRRALEISPGDAQIRHDYAHFLLGQGRQRESVEQTRQAVSLDPVNPMLISCLGWHSLFDSHFEDAARFAAEANALMPDFWANIVLGWAMIGRSHPDSAVVAFREAARLHDNTFTRAALGYGLAVAGRRAEARAVLRDLTRRADSMYISAYDVATIHAALGDADAAFRSLRHAAEERSTFIVHVAWDARFEPLRRDPRFADLTSRQMRLPTPHYAVLTDEERRLR